MFWGLLFVVILVNLPLVHHFWQDYRLSRDGVDVSAEVTRAEVLNPKDDPRYILQFRFDADIDADRQIWPVRVDKTVYDKAKADKSIDVRVRPAHPATYEVVGEVSSPVGWITLLIVDLMLVLLIVFLQRAGRLRRWSDDHAEDPVSGDGATGDYPDQSRPF